MTAASKREHGTRVRYAWGPDASDVPGVPCRCARCTLAARVAERHRRRLKLYGRWEPYVDAGPARDHARLLGRYGVGWKRVASLSGVPAGAVSKLLYGGPGDRPPSRRIRRRTEALILAVQPVPGNLAGQTRVDATATRRRLQALVAAGWPKAQLAARLGMGPGNFVPVMERAQVTAATERAVAALYGEMWDRRPPEASHREKISASRARNYARARGWALPAAWDDSTIADPEAVPAGHRRHDGPPRGRELAAEARELFGFGLDRNQAAERIGVSRGALDHALARELVA